MDEKVSSDEFPWDEQETSHNHNCDNTLPSKPTSHDCEIQEYFSSDSEKWMMYTWMIVLDRSINSE